MRSTLVTDTGVLYAALDASDRDHARCVALASEATFFLPTPVVTETCLIAQSRGNVRAIDVLLDSMTDEGLVVVDLDASDYSRIRHLLSKYAAGGVDFVDVSVMVVAERLGHSTIATLDRRHFSAVRPLHIEAFTLVP